MTDPAPAGTRPLGAFEHSPGNREPSTQMVRLSCRYVRDTDTSDVLPAAAGPHPVSRPEWVRGVVREHKSCVMIRCGGVSGDLP
jgi:hypothetical protein